jgi:outer membrane protein assembly factor BamA
VNVNTELSGNTLALLSQWITHQAVNSSNPSKVLGVEFAQYARADIDWRDFYHLRHDLMLAFRLMAGWGRPYGNSSVLPYAKDYFSGGAYSLRGFQANSVGPGSYTPPDSLKNVFYQEQGGEIKLEANAEFRFPIFKVLKGAVFADAGNVWLNKANIDAPGGQIESSTFLSQIAFSTGAGLRLDLSYFIIRLDIGLPLHNPAYPAGQQWVIENTTFSSLVFNLAFGYPF